MSQIMFPYPSDRPETDAEKYICDKPFQQLQNEQWGHLGVFINLEVAGK